VIDVHRVRAISKRRDDERGAATTAVLVRIAAKERHGRQRAVRPAALEQRGPGWAAASHLR
jgi:hypothetical protein